jgi:hypothetical protein
MKRALLAAVVAVGLLVVFVGGSVFYLSWSACLGGEKVALEEFPHYSGPESGPSPLMGTCQVRYTTQASRKEVLGYYNQRLRKNGWSPVDSPYRAYPTFKKGDDGEYDRLSEALKKTPKSATAGLTAQRDGYTYDVEYWPPSEKLADIPDDKATVTAYVVERQ